MSKQNTERLPKSEGREKAKKIWEEVRKKTPSPELVKIVEDSQTSERSEDQTGNRAAHGAESESSL